MFATLVAEGPSDAAVIVAIFNHLGIGVTAEYIQNGKGRLDKNIPGFNNAAKIGPWVVVRDLDSDAPCAPELARALVPAPSRYMCLRIPVRKIEAWLLADREAAVDFFGLRREWVPADPDAEDDPKTALIDLARRSSDRAVRQDMVPRLGTTARVGPGYVSRLIEFANSEWRPGVAALTSRSLARSIRAIQTVCEAYDDDLGL